MTDDPVIELIDRRMRDANRHFEEQLMYDLYSAPPAKRIGRLRLVSGLERPVLREYVP